MKINKEKLKESLNILKITPQYAIDWINDCVKNDVVYLCLNKKYWYERKWYCLFKKGFNKEIEFNTTLSNHSTVVYGKNIKIPNFIIDDIMEDNIGNIGAAKFSIKIVKNESIRTTLLNALEELKNE